MRVAIIGSREWENPDAVAKAVALEVSVTEPDDVIVSGGAKGVDTWAAKCAQLQGRVLEIYPADWQKHGKAAGMIRNKEIVQAADRVVAFWNGKSRGTEQTIKEAERQGKRIWIHREFK